MTTNVTYRTATPSEVDRILARANAERSAFIASLATKASAKLRGLFAKTPRGAVPA
ncbi:RSP_7527 family protein [Sulfitobacter sp.]|uniref:RSP_7527 family protein n=1 Tax=Sulfitobacter sp. TaxID=1903071 RepID=UPI0039E4FD3F